MKTKVLLLFGIFYGILPGHVQAEEQISPLMIIGGGFEKRKSLMSDREHEASSRDESSIAARTAEQRRNSEQVSTVEDTYDRATIDEPLQEAAVLPREKVTAEEIFSRRYMKLDPSEFEKIAGPKSSWLLGSPDYTNIINALSKYQSVQTFEEKTAILEALEQKIKAYRQKKEEMREVAAGAHLFTEKENAEIERAHRRIDACNLLERGITVEKYRLKDKEMPPEFGLPPRRGIRFRPEQVLEYKSNFGSGMMSSVDRLRHVAYGEKDFIFKEESPLVKLTSLQARQLGFSIESSEKGVTKKEANLSGRSLATYKVDELLGSGLVPCIRYASLGSDGRTKIGHVQDMVDGVALYQEETVPVSEQDLELFLDSYGTEISSLKYYYCPSGWQLSCFHNISQPDAEQPILENSKPIDGARARELALEGMLLFTKKELSSVNYTIHFQDPVLQKEMANAQLLHLITGELDPNPGNFIYFFDPQTGWHVQSIDADLSFSQEFVFPNTDQLPETREELMTVMNTSLQSMANKLSAGAILPKMPLLIDATMGKEILDLTKEQLETALQETRLTSKEIAAAKNRLTAVQKYVQAVANENGFIGSPPTSHRQSRFWGEETYNIAQATPDSSYLGRTLQDQESARVILKELLPQKIQQLECKMNLSCKEKETLTKMQEELNKLQHPPKPTQVTEKKASIPELLQPSDAKSVNSISSKKSNSTIMSLIRAAHNTVYQHRYSALALERNSTSSRGSNSSGLRLSEEVQQLVRTSNEAYISAGKEQEKADTALAQTRKKAMADESSLEELSRLWTKTTNQLAATEKAWSNAVEAYEQEKENSVNDFLIHRQEKLDEARKCQNISKIALVWAQVHQAQNLFMAASQKDQLKGQPLSGFLTNNIATYLAAEQRAWKNLLFHLVAPLKSDAPWKENLEFAKKVKKHTAGFADWTSIISMEVNSMSSSGLKQQNDQSQEKEQAWDQLLGKIKEACSKISEDSHIKDRHPLFHELAFQENYASTQRTQSRLNDLQNNITKLADSDELVTGERNGEKDYVIKEAHRDKLKELSDFWNQLKSARAENKQAWDSTISEIVGSSKMKTADFTNFKKRHLTNPQCLLAWYQADLGQAQKLFKLGNTPGNSDSQEHFLQVKKMCEELLKKDQVSSFQQWQPAFIQQRWTYELKTTHHRPKEWKRIPHERIEVGGNYTTTEIVSHAVKPIEVFLTKIKEFPQCSAFEENLKEMLGQKHDDIRKNWEATLNEIRQLEASVKAALEESSQKKKS